MEIMKTLLALVGGIAIGTGATVGIVTLVNKHRSGKPTLILGKESCPALYGRFDFRKRYYAHFF